MQHKKAGTFGTQNQESPDSLIFPSAAPRQIPVATISLPVTRKDDLATHKVIDEIERLEIEHYLNQGPTVV